jgi:GTP pyrophosphokinase
MAGETPDLNLSEVRRLIEPFYEGQTLHTGESVMAHAEGVVDILRGIRDDKDLLAVAYLYYVWGQLKNPKEWLTSHVGAEVTELLANLKQVMEVSEKARSREGAARISEQPDAIRRLLLALCTDLRVVLLRLASRLQTLRYFAATHSEGEAAREYGAETLALYAPLANRLGIWQIKWELEDLSLRFTNPEAYHEISAALEETREERIESIQEAVKSIQDLLAAHGIHASVSGRPKHIYSIWRKMQKKHLRFDQLYDVRAVRIIVDTLEKCYEVLSLIQESGTVLSKEYDDYIAKPKPNGYQSLHTVLVGKRGKPLEIQIRTRAMHDFAELGVAAHWRYKEGGKSKEAGEEDRVAWLRQMLAWKSDVQQPTPEKLRDTHIYVLTPQGKILELPDGATPIDFAYQLHTELGHRCRGAKVDGAMVPLNTQLKSGQTVEIIAAKTGAPSRDWLNPTLGYTASPRSRTKVRQWFNAQETNATIAAGRDRIGKDLARLGKTAVKLEDLAKKLGFQTVDELCLAAGKDELGQKAIETILAPKPEEKPVEETIPAARKATHHAKGNVLVVGVDSLLTQLAKCCHPVPPDEIVGFVSRGRGIMVHRADCKNIQALDDEAHQRLIEVSWTNDETAVFPVQIHIIARDRMGMLKDLSEIFSKAKQNVVDMSSAHTKEEVHLTFTIEIHSMNDLNQTLKEIRALRGVINARRR